MTSLERKLAGHKYKIGYKVSPKLVTYPTIVTFYGVIMISGEFGPRGLPWFLDADASPVL